MIMVVKINIWWDIKPGNIDSDYDNDGCEYKDDKNAGENDDNDD